MDLHVLTDKYPFWRFFKEISGIPRGSGNCDAISDYIVNFAKERGLRYRKDKSNNVIVFKEASDDCTNDRTVMLQSHLDMVAVKRKDKIKDLKKEGIDLFIDGDFLKADGTSLGADDGIGVAYALEVLDDREMSHPAIEAVFTTDEEIGMLGAEALDISDLKSSFILNIDSEDEGVFTAGCAGTTICSISFVPELEKTKGNCFKIYFNDLTGGHSGIEIDKHRGNAYRLLGRLILRLNRLGADVRYINVGGGGKDNAIAESCEAEILTGIGSGEFEKLFCEESEKIKDAYFLSDPDMKINLVNNGFSEMKEAFSEADSKKLTALLTQLPDGVVRMFGDTTLMTETSLNLGIVNACKDFVDMSICLRSNVDSQREYLKCLLEDMADGIGADISFGPETQIWNYRKDSLLRDIITDVYEKVSGKKGEVNVIHAGVECGFFTKKMPDTDCVSFGPRIDEIHTWNEKLSISSAEMYCEIIRETLKQLST